MNRFAILLLTVAASVAVGAADIPPPRPVDVAALVRQLGSEDFAEREEASRRLSTLSVDTPPAELIEATRGPDPEVRDRATRVLKSLREYIATAPERAEIARLPRGERFARRGQIDLYIASTAVSALKADDSRLWTPAFDVGLRAVEKAEMKGDRKPRGCPTWFKDYSTYRKHHPGIEFFRVDGEYVSSLNRGSSFSQDAIMAGSVNERDSLSELVVSRGPVKVKQMISQALILANGDVTCGHELVRSVLICDGDVTVPKHVQSSLIVARGKITIGDYAHTSNLYAGRGITIVKPYEPQGAAAAEDSRVVEEKTQTPLSIRFFELATVGIEAKAAEKVVTLTAVKDKSAAALAGFKVGDVVAAVGDKKPADVEALRRALRDALALGDATVTVTRDGKPVALKLALPE